MSAGRPDSLFGTAAAVFACESTHEPSCISLEAALAATPCTAILGAPGTGKSTALAHAWQHARAKHAAAWLIDAGAVADIRAAVIGIPQLTPWLADDSARLELFVDGLDEHTLARLVTTIAGWPAARLRVCIACTDAAWTERSATMLRWLGERMGGQHARVYHLAPLQRADMREAAAGAGLDSAAFERMIDRLALGSLARWPRTLHLLIGAVRSLGAEPPSRYKLFERVCLELCAMANHGDTSPARAAKRMAMAAQEAAVSVFTEQPWSGLPGAPPEGALAGFLASVYVQQHPRQDELLMAALAAQPVTDSVARAQLPAPDLVALTQLPAPGIPGPAVLAESLAEWIDERFSTTLRRQVTERVPWLVLRGDVATRSEAERDALARALLGSQGSQQHAWSHIDHWWKLAHPGLSQTLRPWLEDAPAAPAARRMAVLMAATCGCTELEPTLAVIARAAPEHAPDSPEHAPDSPEHAPDSPERAPDSPIPHPDDHLRSLASWARWQLGTIDCNELFAWLQPPPTSEHASELATRPGLGDFESRAFWDALWARSGCPGVRAAFTWLRTHAAANPGQAWRLHPLERQLLELALRHLDDSHVAQALAGFLWQQAATSTASALPDVLSPIPDAAPLRLRVLELVLHAWPANHRDATWLAAFGLLHPEDHDWLHTWLAHDHLTERSDALVQALGFLQRWHLMPRTSSAAHGPGSAYGPETNSAAAPAPEPRWELAELEALAQTSADAGPRAWIHLAQALSLETKQHAAAALGSRPLGHTLGWLQADTDLRARILAAAVRHAQRYEPRLDTWSERERLAFDASIAGLALIAEHAPGELDTIPASLWAAWAALLVTWPLSSPLPVLLARRLGACMVRHAPDALASAMRGMLADDARCFAVPFAAWHALGLWGAAELDTVYADRLCDPTLAPEGVERLLGHMLACALDSAWTYIDQALAAPVPHADDRPARRRLVAIARACLRHGPGSRWPALWRLIGNPSGSGDIEQHGHAHIEHAHAHIDHGHAHIDHGHAHIEHGHAHIEQRPDIDIGLDILAPARLETQPPWLAHLPPAELAAIATWLRTHAPASLRRRPDARALMALSERIHEHLGKARSRHIQDLLRTLVA